MTLAVILICALGAGLGQGITGFGAGILFMSVVPYVLPLISSAGISTFMSVILCFSMAVRYRKHIQWKLIPVPALFFILGGTLAITFAPDLNMRGMKIGFGIFLIILSIYFLFFSARAHIQANLLTMFLCGFISGICDGLFGVGGPLMVLFYLALCPGKEEYLGTIQAFFALSVTWNFLFRIIRGIFPWDLLFRIIRGIFPWDLLFLAAAAAAGAFAGVQIGHRVVNRLNGELLKKATYLLIGISGLITLATSL